MFRSALHRLAFPFAEPSPDAVPLRWARACWRHGPSTGQAWSRHDQSAGLVAGWPEVVRRIPSPPSVWLRCIPAGATDGPAYSRVGGQYHGVADAGRWSEVADDEVLDLREAAVLLGLDEQVVADEAARGNLPGRRIGGQWRFSRAHLLAWLGGGSGQDDTEPPSGRRSLGEEEVDVLLAALPDEPPSPAERAARDDNDALGDR